MNINIEQLKTERSGIGRFFAKRVIDNKLDVNEISDEHSLDQGEHVYEERSAHRWFVIDFSSHHNFDAFIKKTGLDDEIELLYVITPGGEVYYNKLWNLYINWMHSDVSLIKMEEMLKLMGFG